MRKVVMFSVALLVVAIVLGFGAAWASQVTVGQVLVVSDWTLYIRNSNNEPLSFNPYWMRQED